MKLCFCQKHDFLDIAQKTVRRCVFFFDLQIILISTETESRD